MSLLASLAAAGQLRQYQPALPLLGQRGRYLARRYLATAMVTYNPGIRNHLATTTWVPPMIVGNWRVHCFQGETVVKTQGDSSRFVAIATKAGLTEDAKMERYRLE